ncbi:MAG: DNA repair protein RadC [Bacteroidales bacterium]|nr:DNA repair protein RadC [Bacteroidales bacterium]
MTIHDWASTDRPREKMIANGADSLSEVELLAILINTGQKGMSAVDIARNIFSRCHNSLVELAHTIMSGEEIESQQILKGLGPAKICTIKAALELGRRKAKEEEISRLNAVIINSSNAIFAQFNHALSDLDHEELWAIYTSKNGKILLKKCISEGGTDFAGADVKKILRPAIEFSASNVVLCHNHPHSSLRPSHADREMTKKTKEALALFDIRLLDHIIIADGSYYSFADEGEL